MRADGIKTYKKQGRVKAILEFIFYVAWTMIILELIIRSN